MDKSANAPKIIDHKLFEDVIVIQHHDSDNNLQLKEKNRLSQDHLLMRKPFAVVGSQCGAAILRGANIFAPGILGYPYGVVPDETTLDIYVDVKNKTLQGTVTGTINNSKFDSNFDSSTFPPHFIFLGEGVSMMTRRELFRPPNKDTFDQINNEFNEIKIEGKNDLMSKKVVNGVAVKMIDCIFDCPSINEDHLNSLCMLQNLPSIVAGHALMYGNATGCESEMILDMCAAPGGKTTHIASLLSKRGQGKVVALDKSQNKIDTINKNLKRFDLHNFASALVRDSTKLLLKDTIKSSKDDLVFNECMFDRILLDAPCSALGQRPQFNVTMKPKELRSFPKIQRKLFAVAYQLLKPGGVLVYSTCTFTLEENEEMVKWAIDSYSENLIVEDLFSESFSQTLNSKANCDREELWKLGNPGAIPNGLEKYKNELMKTRRFGLPFANEKNEDNDTIGFFIAKFRKN